ncbi:hypothetical protein H0I31_03040 [Tenacibaculum sp. AHE15PA]|uniref:DUF6146 family protein n=1 Tax=unclassified Tenacibaculum TaxID=2635139 RepID=UPI001C4FDFAC|nr:MULTISPECIES: DUF6146 family protein [unclassified Tenacibaculum]QXP72690.1 hypothetical protein H0I30_08300 [Tenacibaculum sp. AHE14PA]QXP76605.1 hypothetical protein H0I31_03040 [Tenacibaculum sp. AHE15PA]
MKTLKYFSTVIILIISFYACGSSSIKNKTTVKEAPVVIKNDSLEYEITIIDIGFTTYLNTIARPPGFHSQFYLENKNRLYVSVWNSRVNNPFNFNTNIYENIIDYNQNVNYGYDVNYKLFNYFEFAQRKYRMTLR